MWLAFGASLGLAQVLAHSRRADRTNLVRVGPFELRVPEGFKVDSSGPGSDFLAHDVERSRRLRILTLPLEDLQRSMSPHGERIEFPGLGVSGVLDGQRQIIRSDEGDGRLLQLRASAEVRSLRRIVVIALDDVSANDEDDDRIRREDEILMHYLAAGLRVAHQGGGAGFFGGSALR